MREIAPLPKDEYLERLYIEQSRASADYIPAYGLQEHLEARRNREALSDLLLRGLAAKWREQKD